MAGADYWNCAVCEGKTFYDVPLYDYDMKPDPYFPNGLPRGAWDLKALCKKCHETHRLVVEVRVRE